MLHDDPTHTRSKNSFLRNLTETIAWCLHAGNIADPKKSLRTFEPRTPLLSSQEFQVCCVSLDRARRLESIGKRGLVPVTDLQGGRLLAYFPDDNLADGYAAEVSKRYFDDDNIPPYDTWVWMAEDVETIARSDGNRELRTTKFLVAWVPPAFLELANAGIQGNPEQCIAWLDELNNPFFKTLQRLSLIG